MKFNKLLKRSYAIAIILWALLNLLLFGASSHAVNPKDESQMMGVIIYPILSIITGTSLLISSINYLLRIVRLILLAALQFFYVYLLREFINDTDGGPGLIVILFMFFWVNIYMICIVFAGFFNPRI